MYGICNHLDEPKETEQEERNEGSCSMLPLTQHQRRRKSDADSAGCNAAHNSGSPENRMVRRGFHEGIPRKHVVKIPARRVG